MSDYNNLKRENESRFASKVIEERSRGVDIMKKAVFDIVAVLLIVALFLFENGELIVKEQSFISFIGNIAVLFVLSILFDNNYRIKGKLSGMTSENYLSASKKLREQAENIDDDAIKRINENLKKYLDEKEREERSSFLYRVGISLSDYDEKYKHLENKELKSLSLSKLQIKGIKKASKVKRSGLTVESLLSEIESSKGEKFKTAKRLDVEYNVKSVFMYLLSALIFAYYAVGLSSDFSWQAFGWFMIKVCFLLFRGVKSYFEAYIEINGFYSEGLSAKCMLIQMLKRENKASEDVLKNRI